MRISNKKFSKPFDMKTLTLKSGGAIVSQRGSSALLEMFEANVCRRAVF